MIVACGIVMFVKVPLHLEVEQVAGNPPGDEQDDIGPEGDRVDNDALEPVESVPEVIP